jgi:hypothetical protein
VTEDHVLKLLSLVIDRVMDSCPAGRESVFNETKELVESMQGDIGSCRAPYTEELPECDTLPRSWRAYGCDNHAHIINLKFGCFAVGRELATKILVLGDLP